MRWYLLTILVMSAATCGQKGPLELPAKQFHTLPDRVAPFALSASAEL